MKHPVGQVSTTPSAFVVIGVFGGIAGSATAQSGRAFYPCDFFPMSIAATDLDADGDLDFAVAMRDSRNEIGLFYNNGDGTFADEVQLTVGTSPRAVIAADLNGDPYTDLVVCRQDQHFTVLIGMAGGVFEHRTHPLNVYGHQPLNICAGDFDEDGDKDLVIVTGGGSYSDRPAAKIFANDGDGYFSPASTTRFGSDTANWSIAVDAGDLDGDGDIDIVAGAVEEYDCGIPYCYEQYTRDQEVCVLINEGAAFTVTRIPIPDQTNRSGPTDIVLRDLDGDDDLDIALRTAWYKRETPGGTTMAVFTMVNDGNGTFGPINEVWTARGVAWGLAVADVDGDGDVDLALPHSSAANLPAHLLVLANDGAGSFASLPSFNLGSNTRMALSICAFDASGDGIWDIAVGSKNRNNGGVTVARNLMEHPGPMLAQTDLVRGQMATFTITEAPPHKRVYFAYGLGEPVPTMGRPTLGGLTLDIGDHPVLIGSAIADATGMASYSVSVPAGAPLTGISTQAVVRAGPGGSDSMKSNFIYSRIVE